MEDTNKKRSAEEKGWRFVSIASAVARTLREEIDKDEEKVKEAQERLSVSREKLDQVRSIRTELVDITRSISGDPVMKGLDKIEKKMNMEELDNMEKKMDNLIEDLERVRADIRSQATEEPFFQGGAENITIKSRSGVGEGEGEGERKREQQASAGSNSVPEPPPAITKKRRGRPPKERKVPEKNQVKEPVINTKKPRLGLSSNINKEKMSSRRPATGSGRIGSERDVVSEQPSIPKQIVTSSSNQQFTDNDGQTYATHSDDESGVGDSSETLSEIPNNKPRAPVRQRLVYYRQDFEKKKTAEYFSGLSPERNEELNKRVLELRNDPTRGTDDWQVVRHMCMDDSHDNLFFACYQPHGLNVPVIQLVQARSYDIWAGQDEEIGVTIEAGQWYCTALQPYYKDDHLPTEQSTWRYEIHKLTSVEGEKEPGFCDGYFSFDDVNRRAVEDDLSEWSDGVCLLKSKSGHFVYGPFSWEDRTKYSISMETWKQCLPLILEKNTRKGPLFMKGFEDSILMEAGCSSDEIKMNKTTLPSKLSCRHIPVRWHEREVHVRRWVNRCIYNPNRVKKKFSGYFWEPEGEEGGEKKKRKARVAGYVELDPEQKEKRSGRVKSASD